MPNPKSQLGISLHKWAIKTPLFLDHLTLTYNLNANNQLKNIAYTSGLPLSKSEWVQASFGSSINHSAITKNYINNHNFKSRLTLLCENPLNRVNEFCQIIKKKFTLEFKTDPLFDGVRFYHDYKHHCLLLHFDGAFFSYGNTSDNVHDDIVKINHTLQIFHNWFGFMWSNMVEWNHLKIPEPTVSQFHLSFNCYIKNYPQRMFGATPKLRKSKNMSWTEDKRPHPRDPSVIIINQWHGGSPVNCYLTVYDKTLHNSESKQLACDRFKTFKFIRKEWKIYTPKIKSLGIQKYTDFSSLMRDEKFLANVFNKCRKICDLILVNDKKLYSGLHKYTTVAETNKILDSNLSKAEMEELFRIHPIIEGRVPRKHIRETEWNFLPYMLGGLNKFYKQFSEDDWVKLFDLYLQLIDQQNYGIDDSHPDHINFKKISGHIASKISIPSESPSVVKNPL